MRRGREWRVTSRGDVGHGLPQTRHAVRGPGPGLKAIRRCVRDPFWPPTKSASEYFQLFAKLARKKTRKRSGTKFSRRAAPLPLYPGMSVSTHLSSDSVPSWQEQGFSGIFFRKKGFFQARYSWLCRQEEFSCESRRKPPYNKPRKSFLRYQTETCLVQLILFLILKEIPLEEVTWISVWIK